MDVSSYLSDYSYGFSNWNGSIEDLLNALNLTSVTDFLDQYDYGDLIPPVVHNMSSSARIALTVFYIFILCAGLVGNVLVIVVVAFNKTMQTVTNVFIVSLSVSDLIITVFSVPFTLIEAVTAEWVLGLSMCKMISCITILSFTSSVLTLTCIALDRFNAICHPLKTRFLHTNTRAIKLLCVVWGVSAAIASPPLFVMELHQLTDVRDNSKYTICTESWSAPYHKMLFTLFIMTMTYILPLLLMGVLYTRICHTLWVKRTVAPTECQELNAGLSRKRKRKVTKMLIVVVTLFFLCWTPYHIITVRREFPPFKDNETNRILLAVMTLLAFSNSCYNPIVYGFLSENYKQHFFSTLRYNRINILTPNNTNNNNIPLSLQRQTTGTHVTIHVSLDNLVDKL